VETYKERAGRSPLNIINQELKVMEIKDKEHYDLMNEFDKQFKVIPKREPKELWAKGFLYQHGETNKAFIAFRHGYGLAKLIYNQ